MLDAVTRKAGVFTLWDCGIDCASSAYVDWGEMRIVDVEIIVGFVFLNAHNDSGKWQGRKDSNLRMAGSKPAALPLGDAPVVLDQSVVGSSL